MLGEPMWTALGMSAEKPVSDAAGVPQAFPRHSANGKKAVINLAEPLLHVSNGRGTKKMFSREYFFGVLQGS